MLRNQDVCKKYDLSSVRLVFSGAAPLGAETIQEVKEIYPTWTVGQAYGRLPHSALSALHYFQTSNLRQA